MKRCQENLSRWGRTVSKQVERKCPGIKHWMSQVSAQGMAAGGSNLFLTPKTTEGLSFLTPFQRLTNISSQPLVTSIIQSGVIPLPASIFADKDQIKRQKSWLEEERGGSKCSGAGGSTLPSPQFPLYRFLLHSGPGPLQNSPLVPSALVSAIVGPLWSASLLSFSCSLLPTSAAPTIISSYMFPCLLSLTSLLFTIHKAFMFKGFIAPELTCPVYYTYKFSTSGPSSP